MSAASVTQLFYQYGIPLIVFAVGFVVRLVGLDQVQLGLDEPFTVFHAQMPLSEIPAVLAKGNNPPLFELVLHPFIKLFGTSEFAVRFPSLVFSSLAGAFVYWLGKMSGHRLVGLVASGLFIFSSHHIYFSHEARVYALWTLFTLAATYYLLKWMQEPNRHLWLAVWTLAGIGMVYSHYFGIIALGLQCLFLFLERIRSKPGMVAKGALAMAAVALVYLPQFLTMGARFNTAKEEHWVPLTSLNELYHTLAKYSNRPVIIVAFLAILVLGGAYLIWKKEKRMVMPRMTLLLLLFFPGAYLLLWSAGTVLPVFLDRYVVFTIPFLYLIVALILHATLSLRLAALAGAALVVAMAFTADFAKDSQSQWREVAAHVANQKKGHTAVLIQPKNNLLAFAYHYNKAWFEDHEQFHELLWEGEVYTSLNPDVQQQLDEKGIERIIRVCVRSYSEKSNPATKSFLNNHTRVLRTKDDVHGIDIELLQLLE